MFVVENIKLAERSTSPRQGKIRSSITSNEKGVYRSVGVI